MESLLTFCLLGQQANGALLVLPEEPFLCKAVDGPGLECCLQRMPSLRKISLALSTSCALHGARWRTLKALLSLPQLEEFTLRWTLLSPVLPDDPGATPDSGALELSSLAHIRSFRYDASPFRVLGWHPVNPDSQPFRAEEEMLRLVLSKLHGTVESLALPAHAAPIQSMAQRRWPRLRELTLTGERWAEPRAPLVSLFANTACLRKAAFALTPVRGQLAEAPPLWPRGHRAASPFSWPDLTHLSLSHPRVEDGVFARLPQTLRSLSLCCCPHKSEKATLEDSHIQRQYECPVLNSAGMLGMLRRCRTPRLAHLALEYDADESEREADLLRLLTVAFPLLESLQVHRCRKADTTVPGWQWSATKCGADFRAVESFGRPLAPLSRLRTVRAYLDYEDAPSLSVICGTNLSPEERNQSRVEPTHHKAAEVLARAVGPSVESVQLWRLGKPDGVVRGSGGVVVRCEEDGPVSRREPT